MLDVLHTEFARVHAVHAVDADLAPADEMQRFSARRFFALFARMRVFIAPAVACVAALVALEGPAWRSVSLCVALTGMITLSVFEFRVYLRRHRFAFGATANLLAIFLAQIAVITATGGLASPLMPGVVVTGILAGLFGSPVFQWQVPLLLHVPWLGALAWMQARGAPESFTPSFLRGLMVSEPTPGIGPWVALLAYVVMVFGGPRLGRTIRGIVLGAYGDATSAKERELALYQEQRRELTMLTGELAHDLKNPLASMKGLAALLGREVEGDKAEEHVRILRGEVDRMQTIVEELLNFSRPLVPLDLEEHDLSRLMAEVAELHEGLLAERRVGFVLESTGTASAPLDRRKIRTVLVNLFQNAIDASPPGETIRVSIAARPESLVLRMRDGGVGIDPELHPRIFEPGVTSKGDGSGLGLTISRTLVMQHEGELTLENAGGAVATVKLPRRAS